MPIIHKAAGIIILERKLLLTREYGKNIFVAPGGKLDEHEDAPAALVRELHEELSIDTTPKDFTFIDNFKAEAAGESGRQLSMDVYLVKRWSGIIAVSHEIEELYWANSVNASYVKIGSIFGLKILPLLQAQGLVD